MVPTGWAVCWRKYFGEEQELSLHPEGLDNQIAMLGNDCVRRTRGKQWMQRKISRQSLQGWILGASMHQRPAAACYNCFSPLAVKERTARLPNGDRKLAYYAL